MNDNSTPHGSDKYDSIVRKTIPFYEEIHNTVIDIIKTVHPSVTSWLDTGCGTGFLTGKAIDIFPKCTFTLADPSFEMLQQAQNRLSTFKRIIFQEPASTENLCLSSGTYFDVITAIQAHHYLDQATRRQALTKCYSHLADNGIFITFENIRPEHDVNIDWQLDRWMDFQRRMGKSEDEIACHRNRFNTKFFPLKMSEHHALFQSTGFKLVEIIWCSYVQAGFFCVK